MLLILNSVSVLAIVGWFGYEFLKGYAAGFNTTGNVGPSAPLGFIFPIFILVVILSIVLSRIDHSGRAFIWAVAPLVYMVVLAPFMPVQSHITKNKWDKQMQDIKQEKLAKVNEKLPTISKEYVQPSNRLESGVRESFITINKENNVLIEVKVISTSDAGIDALPIGKINGGTLEVFNEQMINKQYFGAYVNAQGKTIYDTYRVVYKPNQNIEEYHLEQYEVGQENH